VTDVLSQRALNRATLARQYLLERAPLRAIDAIERLAGMQSQAPLAPYVGLWTRLLDFAPSELATLAEERQVVRLQLMRNTVHLVRARDALDWAALFGRLQTAEYNANFRAGVEGVDLALLLGEASRLLAERPRSRAELGRLLAERWPEAEPRALGYAATLHLLLCQVPPRGVWGKGGAATWAPLADWLGAPLGSGPADAVVDALVLRYLGAFGPASVADVQAWSGLTRLREVVERLPVRVFRGPSGALLYDLPDASRPPEELPAPPRFLPEYDNLLLSHADRTRVIPPRRPVPLPAGNGATGGTFLINGLWQGTWQLRDQKLRIRPFASLRTTDRDALLAEAAELRAFIAPQTAPDIVVEHP
jgi:winged helix DNA-binding protein